jgi:hypothetical protein
MRRAISIVGFAFLSAGAIPFGVVTLIWLIFVGASILSPSEWSLSLLKSLGQCISLIVAFWYGAIHIGTTLLSPLRGLPHGKVSPSLIWGAATLSTACIVFWYLFRHDPKQLFSPNLLLLSIGAVPFALALLSKEKNETRAD